MEAQLARDILREAFGGIVYQIADLLIQRYPGGTSLSAIVTHEAPTSPSTVRQALIVLLRHNLLKVSKNALDGGSSLVYAIRLPQVITRLNFPEYGNQASELFGNIGANLVDELVVHGQLKTNELIETVETRCQESGVAVRPVFEAMVQRRFLVRAQPWEQREAELMAELAAEKAAGTGSKVAASKSLLLSAAASSSSSISSSSSSSIAAASATSTVAAPVKRKVAAAPDPQARAKRNRGGELPPEMKFRMLQAASSSGLEPERTQEEVITAVLQPNGPSSSKRAGRGGGKGGGRGKGGRGAGKAAAEAPVVQLAAEVVQPSFEDPMGSRSAAGLAGTDDTMWLLGSDAFDEHFKHALCCTLVHEKFNSWQARAIVASMLKLSSSFATTQQTSAAVSVQQIYDDLLSGGEETAMERDLLVQFLQMLESDKAGLVRKVDSGRGVDGRTEFVVGISAMLQFLKDRTMHSILTERYETQNPASRGVCSRIFQVLQHVKFAEQNQIAELAMIPMKEARVNLYKMYKDKYVTYQEVPRRDHNPETTLFLWGINNLGGKNNVVVDDAHKTLLNLRLRREAEVAKHRDVIVGLDESLADEVEVARQFRFILEHLDKAILDMARMLRLFNA